MSPSTSQTSTQQRIEEVLRASFDRYAAEIAVVGETACLSYAELDARSDLIARLLRANGLRPNDRVCLLTPKSVDTISVVLGVLKAGGAYVPLDVASPVARLATMIQTCEPCWLVAGSSQKMLAAACIAAAPRARLRGFWQLEEDPFGFSKNTAGTSSEVDDAEMDNEPTDLAYILFTSGSTGQPKGVPIPHRNVIEYIAWANRQFDVKPGEHISSHAPLHFDMSVWDIFGTLAAGAQLHLVPPRANLMPSLLAEYIRDAELTQWYSVPSVLTAMASREVLRQGDFPSLKRIIWGGEAFPVPALRHWMTRVPHATYTNVFGPTEATVNCSFYTLRELPVAEANAVPIGMPIPGRTFLVLGDDSQQPVRAGEIGHLYTGGEGLSPGYWRDAARTAAAFTCIPEGSSERYYCTGDLARMDESGIYHFHGRRDRQIKSRGYRIELDEVAAALGQLPGLVESAVVAVRVDGFEGARICAAFVPHTEAACEVSTLKFALARTLPAYMLPRRWLALERLPRNINGKVDLALLQSLFAND